MASYNTSDFRKGLKVQIDGDPYLMIECNFVKPGKGQALYKCKLRNLIRGTVLDRTYKSGDSLDAADIEEIQGPVPLPPGRPFRLHGQRELRAVRTDRRTGRRRLAVSQGGDGLRIVLFNNKPISITPPNHVVLKVEYCEPAVRGNTATNVTKPAKVETGAEITVPNFVDIGEVIKIDTRTGEYIERVKE